MTLIITFRTMCNRCKTQCEFLRSSNLNQTRTCPNCRQEFVAAEIVPAMVNGIPVFSCASQSTSKSTSDEASSSTASASDKATQPQERELQDEIVPATASPDARGNAN
ncbi:hypothetical protein CARUB_v10006661mg [Capsella rubella]|uniref:Zinc beta-ribbon domain-containing protein n=1 Tax=Capsella rubella TaxID=81985 RepID=R0F194_9BRAS|nr:hypothetical protein CARUB_v10006661mg [Capsella rubella]